MKRGELWAEMMPGDSVYLDARLGFKKARWTLSELREDGFAKVRNGRDTAMIRADCIVGWFMHADRINRSPTPYGQMIAGPSVKKKTPTDRLDRTIDFD